MKSLKLTILLLFIILTLNNCSKKEEYINIGVIAPLKTTNGILLKKSIQLAKKEINEQGGILNKKIKLIYINDNNNVDHALWNLENAIKNKNLNYIVGGMSSGIVVKLMNVMAKYKILWLGTGGAKTQIIDMIKNNYNKYKYYFRVGITDSAKQAEFLSKFILDVFKTKFKFKKYAIIAVNLKWAKASLSMVKKILAKNDLELTYENYFNASALNFKPIFNNAVKSKAQFLISYTLSSEGIEYYKQYHDLKVPLPAFSNHARASRREWWEDTNKKGIWNCFFKAMGAYYAYTPKSLNFYHKFKKTFKKTPGFLSWPGYDTLYILKKAAETSNSLKTETLIKTLEKIEYVGNVRYKFTKNHDLTYGEINGKRYVSPIYFQWKPDGKYYAIWPQNVAEAKYEIPQWIKMK